MLSVNISPKRARHCSSIHCAWRDQIAVCDRPGSGGPGGSRARAAGRPAAARLSSLPPSPLHATAQRPDMASRSGRVRSVTSDRVAWRASWRRPASRPASSTGSCARACGLPPRAQRRLFGQPPRIDGQELATDIHVLLRLAALTGENSLTEGLPPEEARAETLAGPVVSGPPLPMARVEELAIPGPAGRSRRASTSPRRARRRRRRCSSTSTAAAGWSATSRPTTALCRFLAAHCGCRGPLGRLPPRARAPLPGRGRRRARGLRLGRRACRRSSAPTRPGSRSAATAPAATSPPAVCLAGARRRRAAAGDAGC